MADIARLFRPFETRDTTPARRVIKQGEAAAEDAELIVEINGSVKTFAGRFSSSVQYYMTKKWKEPTRSGSLGFSG